MEPRANSACTAMFYASQSVQRTTPTSQHPSSNNGCGSSGQKFVRWSGSGKRIGLDAGTADALSYSDPTASTFRSRCPRKM